MKTPGVAEMIQTVLLNIIQADILMTDKWLLELLDGLGTPVHKKELNKDDEIQVYNYL